MAYNITVLNEENYTTSEWSGGKTTQMYIHPKNSIYKNLDFKWRISSATVELEESDFTELKDVHRFITTLDNELKLTHDYENFIVLKPFEIYEFDGTIKTHSYGKVKDFNLMLSNGATGRLENLLIDKEFLLRLSNKSRSKQYEVFFTYNEPLSFIIEGEKIVLNLNELLIIKLDSDDKFDININSKNKSNLLHATLVE